MPENKIHTWIDRLCPVALGTTILLSLTLVWSFAYLPTQDGPAHLYIATVLQRYNAAVAEGLREVFELNLTAVPNILIFPLLYLLLELFPPLTAEKVLVSLYVVSYPLAAYYAARPLGRNAWVSTFFISSLALSYTFYLGFYNYSFGQVLVLLALGCYLRMEAKRHTGFAVLLGFLGIATYFTHIFPCAALLLMITVLSAWRSFRAWYGAGGIAAQNWPRTTLLPALRRHALPAFLALLPSALLVLHFILASSGGASNDPPLEEPSLPLRAFLLIGRSPLLALSEWDRVVSITFQALAALTILRALRFHLGQSQTVWTFQQSGFLVVTLVFLVLYFFLPGRFAGGHYVLDRLLPFFLISLILWLGAMPLSDTYRARLLLVLAAFTIAMPLFRFPQHAEISAMRAAYVSAVERELPEGGSLLNLHAGPWHNMNGREESFFRVDPTIHAATYAAIAKRANSLKIYQAQSDYFPIRYRESINPYRHLIVRYRSDLDSNPPRINLDRYVAQTGIRPDLITVGGDLSSSLPQFDSSDLVRQLGAAYVHMRLLDAPGPVSGYRLKP